MNTCSFSIKFQKIIAEKQDAYLISRLHGGKLNVIPWPVIESKEFYEIFATLKRRLDLQNTYHPSAREFLNTIKTLMANIKVFALLSLLEDCSQHPFADK